MRVAHFFAEYNSMGGVQSVLHYQLARDKEYGFDSELFVYDEPETKRVERVQWVGPTGNQSMFQARQKVKQNIARLRPELAVYHGNSGVQYFADLDSANWRIQIIHGDSPDLPSLVARRAPWLDGILCVSKPLRKRVQDLLVDWDPNRIGILPYPIHPPASVAKGETADTPELMIGFAGRLEKHQKRVDRLPELIRQLDTRGVKFRFEMLGDGDERKWLEAEFAGDKRIVFHGRRTGQEYWSILRSWDVLFFASDYEGLPIAMLEALSQGAIPVFPKIGTGGDQYTAEIDPGLLYTPGAISDAADIICKLSKMPEAELNNLRKRCQDIVQPHLGDGYMQAFSQFAGFVTGSPAIASKQFPQRPWLDDLCPISVKRRLRAAREKLGFSRKS